VNKLIRWGIWGTGSIAHLVASDFRLVDGAVLHAVASRTPERAQRFAAGHQVPRCYGTLEALLNDAEVDVVYIATPNYRHVDDCLASIRAGKAVLCEKPFALNLSQAHQIAEAARHHKVFCMEAMWTRFIPAVQEAKRCIDGGAIGSIRMLQGNFAYPVPAGSEARFFDVDLGGGALLDRGVYLISLAQQLLGVPQSIRGTACLGATGVDEQSAYQLVYAQGSLADLAASLRVRGSNELIIFGERGIVRLCEPFYRAHRLVLQSSAYPRAAAPEGAPRSGGVRKIIGTVRDAPTTKSLWRRLSPLRDLLHRRVRTFPFPGNGYQFELLHVGHCLREQRTESPIMPLADSLEVMRTMDALRSQMGVERSARTQSDLQISAI
jgi:predicted dehydrogenase